MRRYTQNHTSLCRFQSMSSYIDNLHNSQSAMLDHNTNQRNYLYTRLYNYRSNSLCNRCHRCPHYMWMYSLWNIRWYTHFLHKLQNK